MTPFLDRRLGEFLRDVASDEPAPGAGSVTAIAVALSAGLVAMAARLSDTPGASEWEIRAEAVHTAAAPLAQADAERYAAVLDAARIDPDDPRRERELRDALSGACDVPVAIAGHAAEVCRLAAEAGEHGNPRLRGEAVTAATIAAAAAHSAAELVRLNLRGRQDPRLAEVTKLAAEADAQAARLAD
jgi:formiminotetrahydrofolate cyclodeaminase